MDCALLAPVPGTFAARKMRVDSIMREFADRHEAKSASAFPAIGEFLAARRAATVEAAVLRAAERRH